MKLTFALFASGALALFACAVLAQGDPEAGKALAKGCACHKTRADLDGKPFEELVQEMQAFKAGQGANKPMINLMRKKSEADIQNLAAYYSSLGK